MARPAQFAVLLNTSVRPSVEQLKRAFHTFHNLTAADAVRLAGGAHGILLHGASRDAARAFQAALQVEGVAATVVSEASLPGLPPGVALHRVQLSPEALIIYDVLGRPQPVGWPRVGLIAAAAVRHFELTRSRRDGRAVGETNFMSRMLAKKSPDPAHSLEADSQLILEIVLTEGTSRYQITAAEFPFKYVINRPRLTTAAKFGWLVREICRHAPGALLNHGAACLRDGQDVVPEYINPQMLADEMVWLLWNASAAPRGRTE